MRKKNIIDYIILILLIISIIILIELKPLTVVKPGTDATYYTSYTFEDNGNKLILSNPTLGGRYYGDFIGMNHLKKHLWGYYGEESSFCYMGKLEEGSSSECLYNIDWNEWVKDKVCVVEGKLKACYEGEGCFVEGYFKVKGKAIVYRGIPTCLIDVNSDDFIEHINESSELYKKWFSGGRVIGWNRLYVSSGNVKFYPKQKVVVYEFINNMCKAIEVYEDEVNNYYSNIEECEKNIKYKYYRYINNSCVEVYLRKEEVSNNDYVNLDECEKNLINKKRYYRYINSSNSCIEVSIEESNKTNYDYETIEECMKNIKEEVKDGNGIEEKDKIPNIILIIVVVICIISMIYGIVKLINYIYFKK